MMSELLIYEYSAPGRYSRAQCPVLEEDVCDIPFDYLRHEPAFLPEVSELDVIAGFEIAFPKRRATHEFIITLKQKLLRRIK